MRAMVLSREDRLHLGRVFAPLIVDPQGLKDFRRRSGEAALGHKPAGGLPAPRMDEAHDFHLQSDCLQRPVEIAFPPERVDKTGAAAFLQDASRSLHYIKNVAFNLMLGDRFFLGEAEVAARSFYIRRGWKKEGETLLWPHRPQ